MLHVLTDPYTDSNCNHWAETPWQLFPMLCELSCVLWDRIATKFLVRVLLSTTAIGQVTGMRRNSDLRGCRHCTGSLNTQGSDGKNSSLSILNLICPLQRTVLPSQKLSTVLWGPEEKVDLSKAMLIIISSLWEEFLLFLWEVQLCEDYRSSCWIYSQVSLVIIQGGMSEKIIWSLTLIFEFVEEQLLENSLLVYFPSSIQNSFEQEVIQHRVSISFLYSWPKILLSRVNLGW